ncbi:LysR family transcriptional regulator [Terasakiella sp. A23]|uniref:LysR family transcriptional regulator n=1 Tax=Terasakiella sp. FCG-A23 TaxID=3080561 RepID=UPI002952F458|nr:LysR family transcriptional regulator [Terasakiella sp. A23]MDV7341408.1 LysR family transcriptional regulator [Terasakiella sp. A23]
MDQLSAMTVFTHVVDTGSFSKASQKLSMPLPTVSRKIAELEDHLGAQLLTRTTRKLSLTESGARYLEAARRILNDVQEAERQASSEFVEPVGTMTITAPSAFGKLHVLPIVREFLNEFPKVNIRLQLADQVLHLLDEHIDLGLRIGNLSDSTMMAKPLGHVQFLHCASPLYLKEKGATPTPDTLDDFNLISFGNLDLRQEWTFNIDGKAKTFPIKPRLMVNSAEAAVESAVHHAGITRVLSYQAAEQIHRGVLERVLTDYPTKLNPVHFVYPQGRLVPLKLRTFLDFAAPRLKKRLQTIASQCNIS